MSVLSKVDSRCKEMGITGVMPTRMYGSSVVGVDHANIRRQKSNLAVASGKGLSAGTSNTLAIEMVYGSEAQPDIRAHMEHVEAWLRDYDKYKDANEKARMEAARCKALAKIERRHKNGSKETYLMLSAMSASIISLRLINLAPRSMHRWAGKSKERVEIKLGKEQNIGRES